MKHDQLRAVAHNLAASIAGCSFIVGIYDVDVFEALELSPDGAITADFLRGTVDPPAHGTQFALAVSLVPAALSDFCEKHGIRASSFRDLRARYSRGLDGLKCTVIVEDENGRRSETDYGGWESKRIKTVDPLGRVRKQPIRSGFKEQREQDS